MTDRIKRVVWLDPQTDANLQAAADESYRTAQQELQRIVDGALESHGLMATQDEAPEVDPDHIMTGALVD